ncbi:hypothetical protein D5086_001594 [Populus alba]|uniref:Uncharacterized protein n=1 Tax=Populus alba TaxID=43335 RepID=A0ACC4CZQ4_POPAL
MAATVSSTLQGDVCALINCGQGTCQASNASLLGFECECSSGWKKIEIGPLTFPSRVIPNSCNLVWCGDGTCVANGTGHLCQCNEGSSNLLNETDLACFKQCSLGADCIGLLLGMSPSPPSVQLPPPPLPLPPRVQPRQILFLALRQVSRVLKKSPLDYHTEAMNMKMKTSNVLLICAYLIMRANRLDRSNEFLEESSCIINDIASSNFANMAIEKITDAQHDQNIVYGNNG